MPTETITNGSIASASAVNTVFAGLAEQGNAILDLLTQIQLTTLVEYNHCLTNLQSKSQRAARVKGPNTAALFLVSDFDGINQQLTTATVRADTASASLRERRIPNIALVTSTAFSVSSGLVNALNATQTLLSVTASTAPTGTFTLQLQEAVNISVLSISLAAMASAPTIQVQVSADGVVYTPATSVSLNGSAFNAWFGEQEVLYIQVILTPSHPDNLGGEVYTFGITDFSATTVSYNLISDIYFNPVSFVPTGVSVGFTAKGTGGILYNLLLDNGSGTASYIPVIDGSIVAIPGTATTTVPGLVINSSGVLVFTLPADVYPGTITLRDTTSGVTLPIVANLSPTDPNLSYLSSPVASLVGSALTILPTPAVLSDNYTISYVTGPASIEATLFVHLYTSDRTQTPVFEGASLEEY